MLCADSLGGPASITRIPNSRGSIRWRSWYAGGSRRSMREAEALAARLNALHEQEVEQTLLLGAHRRRRLHIVLLGNDSANQWRLRPSMTRHCLAFDAFPAKGTDCTIFSATSMG
jgi:hypothetical protein